MLNLRTFARLDQADDFLDSPDVIRHARLSWLVGPSASICWRT
jgi:hypothetical protein